MKNAGYLFIMLLILLGFILFVTLILKLTENTPFFQLGVLLIPIRMDYLNFIQLKVGDRIVLLDWKDIRHGASAATFNPYLPEYMQPLFGCEHKIIRVSHTRPQCVCVPDYDLRESFIKR